MHAASVHFTHSEKKEGFVLARFCLEMAYVFLLNGCFLPGSGFFFPLLSSMLTFLVSSPGLNMPPADGAYWLGTQALELNTGIQPVFKSQI